MSFNTGTQTETLYSLPTAVTKNTYTTQAVFSAVAGTTPVCAYPGGWLLNDTPNPVGRSLWLHAEGTIANASAATFAGALGFDSTAGTIANSITMFAATAPTASVTAPWHLDVWYTCTAFATSTATFQVNGAWSQEAVASGAALSASAQRGAFTGTISAFNPANTFFIELFGTWSASSASNTTTLNQMFLFGLN